MGRLTPADVREITSVSGLAHAEFCVEQESSKIGRDAAEPLWATLAALVDEG